MNKLVILAYLRMYMHLRTPTTAAIRPPTTVIAITRARNKNKMADILEVCLTFLNVLPEPMKKQNYTFNTSRRKIKPPKWLNMHIL